MSTRSLDGAEWIVVRLSQVPEDKRVRVADRLIEDEGLVGTAMLQMRLAALHPVQDPKLRVKRSKLRQVGMRL